MGNPLSRSTSESNQPSNPAFTVISYRRETTGGRMNRSGTPAATRRLRLGPVAAAGCLLISTCSGYIERQKVTQEEIKAADVALDRDRILMLTGDTDLPHDDLGG